MVGGRTVTCRFQLLSAFVNGQWQSLPNLETSDFFFMGGGGDLFIFGAAECWFLPRSANRSILRGPQACALRLDSCAFSICKDGGRAIFFAATTESTLQRQDQLCSDRINLLFSDRINFSATGSTFQRPIQLRTDKFKFAATKSTLHRQNQLCSDRINNNYNSDKRADFKI